MITFTINRGAIAMCCAGLMYGCTHASHQYPPAEGHSSFRFIEPTPPPKKRALGEGSPQAPQARDTLIPAEPIGELVSPRYPEAALGSGLYPVIVAVRLGIDANGRVTQVQPSATGLSTPTQFSADFHAAVEEAVKEWVFLPAEIRHLVPVPEVRRDDSKTAGDTAYGPDQLDEQPQLTRDYWLVVSTQNVESSVEVSFTFTPSGQVLADQTKRVIAK